VGHGVVDDDDVIVSWCGGVGCCEVVVMLRWCDGVVVWFVMV
jgi:hypothetical protein